MQVQSKSVRSSIAGPAGPIEILHDQPLLPEGQRARGVAVIAHPHPLFGGSMDNKVAQTLARAFVLAGWQALRFNFRGVGASAGVHDGGRAETDDLLALVEYASPSGAMPAPALALAGFSFGAYVVSQALARLPQAPEALVLVGTAASRFDVAPVPADWHARTLVLHGEQDDTVPLAAVLDWARPQTLPVTVIPGGGHFFHGQLPLLRGLVQRHLQALASGH